MCHDHDARPPLPPIAGASGPASTQRLVLEAEDGNRFNAFSATTVRPDAPGVMILPDFLGLGSFYEELAVRFAEAGVHATAMDPFGRSAGLDEHGDGFEPMPHVLQLTPDGTGYDTAATLAYLRSEAGGSPTHVYSVGFCLGGRMSFNQAWRDHGLAGVVGFYGGPQGRGPDDETAPIRSAPQYRCPVLGLFGGADEGIPPEAIERFSAALDEAGVQNEMVIYPGAPHSFFDRKSADYKEACDDAWTRVLRFVGAIE
jgi:carboxymethylenebutenolidase